MFKAKKGFVFDALTDSTNLQYTIAPNDILNFKIYSKDGYKLVDVTTFENFENNQYLDEQSTYVVEQDGQVKLPVIGRVNLNGYSLKEAEMHLESKYSEYYINPFVQLSIANKRVVVFTGEGHNGRVVPLKNENTTLIEALGLAGGISKYARSREIYVLRDINGETQVYNIDLSRMDGVQHAGMIMQANDVIYVRPSFNFIRESLEEISPLLSLVASTLGLLISWQILRNQ